MSRGRVQRLRCFLKDNRPSVNIPDVFSQCVFAGGTDVPPALLVDAVLFWRIISAVDVSSREGIILEIWVLLYYDVISML